jgi:hypothetical protein
MNFSLFSRAQRSATECRPSTDGQQRGDECTPDQAGAPVQLRDDELKLIAGGDYDPTPKGGWNPPVSQAATR